MKINHFKVKYQDILISETKVLVILINYGFDMIIITWIVDVLKRNSEMTEDSIVNLE